MHFFKFQAHPSALGGGNCYQLILSSGLFPCFFPLPSLPPRNASARCDKADKRYLYRAIKTISPRSFEMIIALGPRLQVS